MQKLWNKLDLKAKILAILIFTSLPTFFLVTLGATKVTKPLLEQEIKNHGFGIANSIASNISREKWFSTANIEQLENLIEETIQIDPGILRLDIIIKNTNNNFGSILASNFEIDKTNLKNREIHLLEKSFASEENDETARYWKICVPIFLKHKKTNILMGNVALSISTKFVSSVLKTLWTITAMSSIVTFFILVIVFSYVFKKTIVNDRTLKLALSQNLELTRQLQDLEQKLLTSEKLAAMGQLTAKFAHEVGTPLNSMGGHLHLLKEEIGMLNAKNRTLNKSLERTSIIQGELLKIEKIVRNFLKVTEKPLSPLKELNINDVIEKTVALVRPKAEVVGIQINISVDNKLKPLRAASIDLEHLLLNLINNSLDSLEMKGNSHDNLYLDIRTEYDETKNAAKLIVFDTGIGIKSDYLSLTMEPFFTTKDPMKGTGLGLAICKDIVKKYSGNIEIESEENQWTRVNVSLPYPEHL